MNIIITIIAATTFSIIVIITIITIIIIVFIYEEKQSKNLAFRWLIIFLKYHIVTGGGSLFTIHSDCEVYNPKTDAWTPIAPMNRRRSRSGVTGLRRLLYLVGG